jgi:uncharacterized protein GlcG (DUF336 family)
MKSAVLGWYVLAILASMTAWGNEQLTKSDVEQIIAQAATRAEDVDIESIIAVVDRDGYVLGVWDVAGDSNPNVEDVAAAIARAGTAAFLSSEQNAFTSRTAGYIIQQHFPPFVVDTPPGPLVGVGISSVFLNGTSAGGHSDVNFMKQIPLPPAGSTTTGTFDPNITFAALNPFSPAAVFPALAGGQSPGTYGASVYTGTSNTVIASGTGAVGTSLNDAPGGVPLYKGGELVGGVGVTGHGAPINISTGFAIILSGLGKITTQADATPGFTVGPDTDEDVALAGETGYAPPSSIMPTQVYLGGIQLPYVDTTTDLNGVRPFGTVGVPVNGYPVQQSPPRFNYPAAEFGGVSGEMRFPMRSDPNPGLIDNVARLSAGEVGDIITNAAKQAALTRSLIRHPLGTNARVFISVVGNPGLSKAPPPILGVFRMNDATIFSWDVAVQKARTAFFFSSAQLAESSRTVGFLAQRYYPPGIDGTQPGPFFGFQEALLIDAFLGQPNPYLTNQVTIFPGGFPLYRGGVLIGAIGVSGDGVDQDDIIAAAGCNNFLAPSNITADNFLYLGARLPYAKFPVNP